MTYKFSYERPHLVRREANRVRGEISDGMVKVDIIPHNCTRKKHRESQVIRLWPMSDTDGSLHGPSRGILALRMLATWSRTS